MSEVDELTLEEARQVAEQIRTAPRGFQIDRENWPWVINALCDKLEAIQGEGHYITEDLDGERLVKKDKKRG